MEVNGFITLWLLYSHAMMVKYCGVFAQIKNYGHNSLLLPGSGP
jgi:hypothetical protein